MGDLQVKRLVWKYLESNMYLLKCGKHFLIIDPVDNEEVLKYCSNADSVTVFLTHEHFDHIYGVNTLRSVVHCKVIASKECSERITDIKANMSVYAQVMGEVSGKEIPEQWEPFTCQAADIVFANQCMFNWMGHSVEMVSTPGHSAGSSCILLDDMLFVGDSILWSNLMVKFPGSSKRLYREVTVPLLEKLLAKARIIYPGHDEVMTPEEALKIIRSV